MVMIPGDQNDTPARNLIHPGKEYITKPRTLGIRFFVQFTRKDVSANENLTCGFDFGKIPVKVGNRRYCYTSYHFFNFATALTMSSKYFLGIEPIL